MKKLFILGLLMLAIPAICMAADSTRAALDVAQVVGIGDGSSGYMLEINSDTGAAMVASSAKAVTSQYGDGQIYTGACRLLGIYIMGATAGDYAAIYDGTSATGVAKFDPRIAANTSSTYLPTFGAPFATGIYVDAIDANTLVTVVYDY